MYASHLRVSTQSYYTGNVFYSSLGGVYRVNKDENDVDVVDKTQEEESAEK